MLWVTAALLTLICALVIAYLLTFLGTVASAVAAVLALFPLAIVLLAVRAIDRWEPEPRGLVIFALAWGAVAAVAFALVIDTIVVLLASPALVPDVLSSVVQAPVVEEIGKGAGLLLLFLAARRSFDGPIDGIVYGALIGAGFAFTENIIYFASSLLTGGVGEAAFTFFLRGILSPFAHVMFTAVIGYALGLAARAGYGFGRSCALWLVGLVGGIALHALWNGSALFADFFALYATLQVPLFVGAIVAVILLRREEARLTRERLGEYAAVGWFTPAEVDMLATGAGRRQAVAWARTLSGDRSRIMKTFISEATALAAARQRVTTGRDRLAAADERVYLERATAAREQLLAP